MSEPESVTPPEDTTDYKAKFEEMEGKYKSLQSKYNKTAKIPKEEASELETQLAKMQEQLETLSKENTTIKKTALLNELASIAPKLVDLHSESDVATIQAALITAKALKTDWTPRSTGTSEEPKKGLVGVYNHATGKYE